MTASTSPPNNAWAPDACTLPTTDRPLRVSEWDTLFAESVTNVRRRPGGLALALDADPAVAARAADLATREAECCSFFTFTLTATGGALSLGIAAPDQHADVVEALAVRAEAARR